MQLRFGSFCIFFLILSVFLKQVHNATISHQKTNEYHNI